MTALDQLVSQLRNVALRMESATPTFAALQDGDTIREAADLLEKLIGPEEHIIEFYNGGWTIQHPLAERLDGTLFDCDATWTDGDIGLLGRFLMYEDGTLVRIEG